MTQPQDKMRAEFEENMLQQRSHSDFSRDDGGYFSPWMQAAWTGWRLACAQQDALDAPGLLLTVIQRLNGNPYSLTKGECISEVEAMRDAAIATQGASNV